MLWCVYGDIAKTKEKQKNCNAGPKKTEQVQKAEAAAVAPFLELLNEEVLEMRMDHIKQRFNIKGSKIKGYSDNSSGRQYVKELSPYPTFCHAITQSTNMVDNMTLHLERLFPRNRSKKWLYEWILDLQDVRLKPDMVVPALSAREKEYIMKVSPMMETKYGSEYFVSNVVNGASIERVPWEMGFMSSRVHPQNIYNKLAAELSRYIILGPSGTLEFMLNVAEIFDIDLRIMTLASITWMYVARDHSLFEMMIVANQYFEPPLFKFEPITGSTSTDPETIRRAQYKQALINDHQQLIDLLTKIDPTAASAAKSESFIPNELGYLEFIHGSTATLTQIGGEVPVSCRFNLDLKGINPLGDNSAVPTPAMTDGSAQSKKEIGIDKKYCITVCEPSKSPACTINDVNKTISQLFRKTPLSNEDVNMLEGVLPDEVFKNLVNSILKKNVASWKWEKTEWGSSPSPSHLISPEEDIVMTNVSNSGLPDRPTKYDLSAKYKELSLTAEIIDQPTQKSPTEPKTQLSELLGAVSLNPTNSIGTNVFKKRLSS
jgi:hypothetical protein